MPPGRRARLSTPEQVDRAVAAGRMHPGDGEEVKRFMSYLADKARIGHDVALAKWYPEYARPSDDVVKQAGNDPRDDEGSP